MRTPAPPETTIAIGVWPMATITLDTETIMAAQPMYSEDGRFQWNGVEWIPTTWSGAPERSAASVNYVRIFVIALIASFIGAAGAIYLWLQLFAMQVRGSLGVG